MFILFIQNMSGYGVSAGGGMAGGGETDALARRLREAERARADAERAHADALAQLRGAQRSPLDAHNVEQLQSRARELEKKVFYIQHTVLSVIKIFILIHSLEFNIIQYSLLHQIKEYQQQLQYQQ